MFPLKYLSDDHLVSFITKTIKCHYDIVSLASAPLHLGIYSFWVFQWQMLLDAGTSAKPLGLVS